MQYFNDLINYLAKPAGLPSIVQTIALIVLIIVALKKTKQESEIINKQSEKITNENKKIKFENKKIQTEIEVLDIKSKEISETVTYLRRKVDSFWKFFSDKPILNKNNKARNLESSPSLFGYRLEHFTEEKQLIARGFVSKIYKLLKDNEKNKKFEDLILLLGSGSTIYCVFLALNDLFRSVNLNDQKLLQKVIIITNNLPGILYLSDNCRLGDSTDAEMIFTTHVLPGRAEGKYAAILGSSTASYIKNYIEKYKNSHIVGAITGNYISLKCGILIRGEYHDEVKEEIINNSNEIYVLSPLSKFSPFTFDEINSEFIIKDDFISINLTSIKKNKEYKKIDCNIFEKQPLKSFYIITSSSRRSYQSNGNKGLSDNKLGSLYSYFENISGYLRHNLKVFEVEFNPLVDCEQIIYDSKMTSEFEAVLKYEFPHLEMRNWIRKRLQDGTLSFSNIYENNNCKNCNKKDLNSKRCENLSSK